MRSTLLGVGLVDVLAADPRPTFVLDLASHLPTILYTNPAFANHPALHDLASSTNDESAEIWQWVTSVASDFSGKERSPPTSLFHANLLWTLFVLPQKYMIVSANEQISPKASDPRGKIRIDVACVESSPSPDITDSQPMSIRSATDPSASLRPEILPAQRRTRSTPGGIEESPEPSSPPVPEAFHTLRRSTTDPAWILPDIVAEQRPYLEVIHNVDWTATPLGSMSGWSARLSQMVNQILADSRPIALYWGKYYTTIYNEAFSKLCGSKHPNLLGRPVDEGWPDAGDRLKEMMRAAAGQRTGSIEDEWRFFVERESNMMQRVSGWPQETYLKWSIVPIMEGHECLGFMHPVLETTSMRLWERRMKMLIELGEVLVTARDVKSYWAKTIEELESVEPRYDIPLAILYSVDEDPEIVNNSSGKPEFSKVFQLEGSLGVPPDHPISPQKLALRSSSLGLAPMFREALKSQQPLLLQTSDGTLPEALLEGLQWRGFGDPCRAAVILALRPTETENVMGLLFLGLNPRRPYDNDYRQYISLLNQKLTTSLASTVLLEEEARRGRNMAEQAAYDQAMLKEELEAQTKVSTETMRKFEAVAEFIPVGMCFGDYQGHVEFANDAWYRITGYPGDGPVEKHLFMSCVVEEDRPIVERAYEELLTARTSTFEFRVKRRASSAGVTPSRDSPSFEKAALDLTTLDDHTERHVLASLKAERATDGSVIRVLTCLTDVTLHRKTAEEAVRRAQQAENLKRMAQYATVGMYDMDLNLRLLGANDVFFEMCGLDKTDPSTVVLKPWEICVKEDDYALLTDKLSVMVAEGKVQNVEVRFKSPWTAEDGAGHKVVAPRWVQATLLPVRNAEGVIRSFTGCLSDVSLQKWQLEREKQRKEEAIESRRQQENFIDMTSHEMRNPLSAIIQCADAVTGTLSKVQELMPTPTPTNVSLKINNKSNGGNTEDPADVRSPEQQLIDSCIDNAETIVECAQHQKRIVDDILTMSKLDSKLLAVTPITVNTVSVMQEAIKMFEVEARRVDIDLNMAVDKTYTELGHKYLNLDPSRLKQVLINLLTNALKFTKSGPTRSVSVTMGASRTRPTDATSSVQFIPPSLEPYNVEGDPVNLDCRGDSIFLVFEVKDTGQGLTEDEKKSLFQRFVQASSRTHVKYGGSGLGLFIIRRLTELQNGAIGVASRPGVGSTFAFFIEAYVPTDDSIREAEAASNAANALAAATSLSATVKRNKSTSSNRAAVKSPQEQLITAALKPSMHSVAMPEIRGVLIVEDNIINQQITRRGLRDKKYIVDVANHGVEALEKLRLTDRFIGDAALSTTVPNSSSPSQTTSTKTKDSFPLSLILMDIEMPLMDGLTCTRQIRELEVRGKIRGGRLPIIAVSANARMEQILEAKAAGCDDVLVKPYRMPELIEKMNLVVARLAGVGQSGLAADS